MEIQGRKKPNTAATAPAPEIFSPNDIDAISDSPIWAGEAPAGGAAGGAGKVNGAAGADPGVAVPGMDRRLSLHTGSALLAERGAVGVCLSTGGTDHRTSPFSCFGPMRFRAAYRSCGFGTHAATGGGLGVMASEGLRSTLKAHREVASCRRNPREMRGAVSSLK